MPAGPSGFAPARRNAGNLAISQSVLSLTKGMEDPHTGEHREAEPVAD